MNKQQKMRDRLYKFALGIVQLVRRLPKELVGNEKIGRQLIRSGTSVAANYEEAIAGFSKEDFIYKISISFRESKEANLWLRLLKDSGVPIHFEPVDKLTQEADEISHILAKSLKTSRANLEAEKLKKTICVTGIDSILYDFKI
ncbi:MAG: four helix bundle protein [Candidatus Omnitrophica bacterium]|nr:four helix bundle protein [Candidatus Omnitrophota bacterium]